MGDNDNTVSKSYAAGAVKGSINTGGLVGTNGSYIADCYATGAVGGDERVGGLAGLNNGIIYDSYYDIESTGQADTGKGEPRTTAEMKLRSTYTYWDFIDVWGIEDEESYPLLRWQEGAPKSGFVVEAENSWASPGSDLKLIFSCAKGEDDELLNGNYLVTVYSDIEGTNLWKDELEFIDGEAVILVSGLNTVGIHNLRVYVDGITYSNLVTVGVIVPEFAGGSGTKEDPFLIESADQLNRVRYFLTANFRLKNDIDLGTAPYGYGEGWEPIGNEKEPFRGSFDGNGYVISNLTINRPEETYVGLFGITQNAVLRSIKLENVNVTGYRFVGGLVGFVDGGAIESCQVSGSVNANYFVGGLAGEADYAIISDSFAEVEVTAKGYGGYYAGAGGLVGFSYDNSISNSHVEGEISGPSVVGGLVGDNYYGSFSNSSARGIVKGNSFIGGLIGACSEADISGSRAEVTVTGGELAGGLIGYSEMNMIADSSAEAEVVGYYDVGGLVGASLYDIISASSATAKVSGEELVGGLVGEMIESIVQGSHATSQVKGKKYVGGLIGGSSNSFLTDSYAEGNVEGLECVGGLVGIADSDNEESENLLESQAFESKKAKINDKINEIKEKGVSLDLEEQIGYRANRETKAAKFMEIGKYSDSGKAHEDDGEGRAARFEREEYFNSYYERKLAYQDIIDIRKSKLQEVDREIINPLGMNSVSELKESDSFRIENCYVTMATITGEAGVGGLVGANFIEIKNSYATATVYGKEYVGGLAGYSGWLVDSCYAIDAEIYGENHVGGLVGENDGWILDSYAVGIIYGNEDVGGLVGTNFGYIEASYVRNVNIDGSVDVGGLVGQNAGAIYESYADGSVEGKFYVGGLVGYNYGAVMDSYATGAITGEECVGCLIGYNLGYVINCYATGNVEGIYFVGGLVGDNSYEYDLIAEGIISESYASVNVVGEGPVGGLVGQNIGSIYESYADGSVEGVFCVGGLAGYNFGYVVDCYATGATTGEECVGGLVGFNVWFVGNCYATGKVTGTEYVGGLVGDNYEDELWVAVVKNSYYDGQSTGQGYNYGKGERRTTAEMKLRSTYQGWDFIDVWSIRDEEGYPMLRWQAGAPKSGFNVEASESRIALGSEVQLIITDAMDENGDLLNGFYEVEVNCDVDGENMLQAYAEFSDGTATLTLKLKTGGRHNLRVFVEGITYSNLIIVDVFNIAFADGSGTKEDPYQIENAQQLNEVRNFLTASFKLISDIDLNDLTVADGVYSDSKGWEPIGDADRPFQGSFDGNGYVIKNLTINRPEEDLIGLFGVAIYADLRNIKLENVNVTGQDGVGALAGGLTYSNVVSFEVFDGSVSGQSFVGGLIGQNIMNIVAGTSSNDSYINIDVTGEKYVGVLAGGNLESYILYTTVTGTAKGSELIGGLAGANLNSVVFNVISDVEVAGGKGVGGLVGINADIRDLIGSDENESEPGGNGDSDIEGLTGLSIRSISDDLRFYGNKLSDQDLETFLGRTSSYNIKAEDILGKLSLENIEEIYQLLEKVNIDRREIKLPLISIIENSDTGESETVFYSLILGCSSTGSVSGYAYVGGLVGENQQLVSGCFATGDVTGLGEESFEIGGLVGDNIVLGTINNCVATGDVRGGSYVGGLTGFNDYIVEYSNSRGAVVGVQFVGGLVGFNEYNVVKSYAEGSVSGQSYVGGLAGVNTYSIIESYATASVDGESFVGGLAGENSGLVQDSFALGDVCGNAYVGGLVGINYTDVLNCYATGVVTGIGENAQDIGGLVGYNFEGYGVVYNSYYDSESTGQSDAGKGEQKTTAEMQLRSTYEGWDFLQVWSIKEEEDYPMLRWQAGAPQSGFEVEAERGWALPEVEFNLNITNAKGEDGVLTGSKEVRVYSDVEEEYVFDSEVDFTYGEATVRVALNNEGRHNLRVYVDGISYSNLVTVEVVTQTFAGGTGKEGDPFLIETAEQLNMVRYFPKAYFELNSDIDLGSWTVAGDSYNDGKGWEPIGSALEPFQCHFDGNGFTINNLMISRPEEDYVGLFGKIENSVLRNIKLENVSVSGQMYVGGLVGYMEGGTIESCRIISGNVYGNLTVGGIVGNNNTGEITSSSAKVDVIASKGPYLYSMIAGGLVGNNRGGVISDCHADGYVSGDWDVGGLVGVNTNNSMIEATLYGKIINSSAKGEVAGTYYNIGGLVGRNTGGIIEDSHAESSVKGTNEVGGLVGNNKDGKITGSHATGNVDGENNVGGLVGISNNGNISNCYAIGEVRGLKESSNIGGLVGKSVVSTISDSYASGNVSGDINVGGLVGCVNSEDVVRDPSFSDIIKCNASGNVSGNKHVGGLVGINYGKVEYSYATGNVKGETYVGGLVGFNSYFVSNCYATGFTEGKDNIGGLVGFNDDVVMSSNASGTTEGETYVGGLVGFNYGLVEYCYADTDVFAKTYVGGLVGHNDGITEGSYTSGNVMGEDFVGGLVGYNIYEVTDSYATGTVFGSIGVGGLVGINKDQVTNCYAIGLVYGGTVQGGLIGINDGYVTNSYYDKETSGQSDTGKGEPKTTAEMKLRSTYQDWNFEYVWSIREGETYPMFYWQEEAPQSSFVVELDKIGVLSGMAFNLYINYARGEDGEPLNGFYQVKVDSDLDGENVVNKEFIFIDGKATVPVTLDAVGIHKLRIYVKGISFSNVVEIYIARFAGGSGTEEEPFEIETAEQLNGVKYFLTSHFKLVSDIDLSTTPYSEAEGWKPIGNESEPFQGSFDGNGKIIRNLKINRPEEDYIGLFGNIKNADLRNIRLENVDVSGMNNVGAVVGFMEGGTIDSCHVSGIVRGSFSVGGLAGSNKAGYINYSSSKAEVVGSYGLLYPMFVGGLVGYNEGGSICESHVWGDVSGVMDVGGLVGVNTSTTFLTARMHGQIIGSSASGKVVGSYNTGGLVGRNDDGIIESSSVLGSIEGEYNVGGLVGIHSGGCISASFSEGDVTGKNNVGGLVGSLNGGEVTNSYSLAKVAGDSDNSDSSKIGGLVGAMEDSDSTIEYSFAAGPVIGEKLVGGLVGYNEGSKIIDSYYDSETTGRSDRDNEWGIPKSTAEMMKKATFNTWDFDNVWSIVENQTYPYLQWEDEYGFTVVLAQAGYKEVNKAFEININDAIGISIGIYGYRINGERIVAVTSDIEGEVFSGPVLFEDGNAAVSIILSQAGEHKLTVSVSGIAEPKAMTVTVVTELVASTYKFRYQMPTDIIVGKEVAVPVTFVTEQKGYFGYDGVRFKFAAEGPGEVTFKAIDSEGIEHSFVNVGYWGPEGGFDIPAEYEATTEWKLVFSKAGEYTITFSLIDAETEEVIAGISDTVEINVKSAGSSDSDRKEKRPKAETKPSDESRISIPTKLDRSKGVASGQIDEKTLKGALDATVPNEHGIKTLEIDVTKIDDAKAYEITLPADALIAGDVNIKINTAIGSITLPGNMLPKELSGAKTVSITIGLADKSKLSPELQQKIGDRPVIELSLNIDGKAYSWSNDDVPVTVSIPYTPMEEELRDPEHITVWYIDSEGNIIEVPSGRYDPETSSVIFSITHFSRFAVVYVTKDFDDLDSVPWARKAIEVLASKGIIRGKTETEYAPQTDISRAEFLYSLVRALGVTASFEENFDDVEIGAYYYKEIGIAKKLGIAKGIGNNKFSPDASITRQDLMVLTERALRMLKKLETHGADSDLDRFEDKSLIADYAIDSIASLVKEGLIVGSAGKLNPLDNTTRAEAAVFLYRIYNMIYGSK